MPTTSTKRPATKPTRAIITKSTPAANPATPLNGDGPSPSSGDVLRRLYFSLLRHRLALEHGRRLPSTHQFDSGIAEESVVVGCTFGLQAEDTVAAAGSDLSGQIAKGIRLADLIARTDGGLAQLPDISTEDTFNFGTGMALAHKLAKKRHVVVAFCPDDSPAVDRWQQAMKTAAALKLPVVYVIKSSAATQPATKQAGHLKAFSYMTRAAGFPGIVVDGHDVVAVWRVAQECVLRARNGGGPSLMECTMESRQDPLAHMEHYLKKRNLWEDDWRERISREIGAEIKGH